MRQRIAGRLELHDIERDLLAGAAWVMSTVRLTATTRMLEAVPR
jgi:hypothetical protein